jgi:meso-butanediol dehydrogenase/(S,S)-butanediol dehydrogenase/diacetyl reductase
MDIEGKVAVVTGGARGIGRGIAAALAKAGADVLIGDRLDDANIASEATETVQLVEAAGRRAVALRCDVTSQRDCEALMAAAVAQLGGLHIVCPNAGVQSMIPVVDLELGEWERVLRVNATGTFLTCKAALPHLISQKLGSIVNMASITGLRGSANMAHYSASKFAVVGFTEALAAEVARDGVRVNCICPDGVRSDMTLGLLKQHTGIEDDEKADALWTEVSARRAPLGLSVEPSHIGEAVVYLCQAETLTGVALPVTAGAHMAG